MLIAFVSAFTGFSVFAILYVAARKLRPTEQYKTKIRLQNLFETPSGIRAGIAQERKASLLANRDWASLSFTERVIKPIIETIQGYFLRLAPRAIFKTVERYILLAGKQDVWNVNKIILVWGTVIIAFFLIGLAIFFMTDFLLIQRITMLVILVLIGIGLPISHVNRIIKERQEKIVSELPPFLDLLSVSVQAGLSFDASIDRILRRSTGTLMNEFRQMQKDMRLGLSKKEALHEMAARCDLEDVYLFTTSVIQAERLGTSMGKTLVEQADNMRERYQQRIKAKALKAPIKILFPLVLLIFPTIFIIILLPPLIIVLENLNILPKF